MTRSKKHFFQTVICLLILVISNLSSRAQDKIEGVWLTAGKDAKIEIYKSSDSKFYGKIVWMKEPLSNGKPKLDTKNSNEKLRNQPILGLVILKGFEKSGDVYEDGSIYDPQSGKTYDCKMTYKGKTLSIRGFIGISLIGRTTVWEKVI